MLPLHVRFITGIKKGRVVMAIMNSIPITLSLIAFLSHCPEQAFAQEKGDTSAATAAVAPPDHPAVAQPPVAAVPVINLRERPKYINEPHRLRRTVQIDGVLSDGEWDPFYTINDGAIKGTVYCNWDDSYLYLAARTDQQSTILIDVDTGGDGWLRSADNLELVIGNVGEPSGTQVIARLLDAANSKDTPSWNEKVLDTKLILVASKITNGTQIVEVAIPKNMASLVLRAGATIGLRAEFMPAGPAAAYIPTQPFEPHLLLDATLVDALLQSVPGINPKLTISDNKCIAGQTLFATLELLNQTDAVVPIKSVSWAGQGNSINAVNSIREVTVPPLPSLKTLKLTYKTLLPTSLIPGTYSLFVSVDIGGGRLVQAAATFTVVEPLQAQISSDPQPVAILGPTKVNVLVDIFSAVPNMFNGDTELTLMPSGWELLGAVKRGVHIDREDARKVIRYTFKLPSTTPAGDYPVEASVKWHGRIWKLRHTVQVVRTESTVPVKPAAPPIPSEPAAQPEAKL